MIIKGYPEAVLRFWVAHPEGDAIADCDDGYAVLWCVAIGRGRLPLLPDDRRITRSEVARVLLEVGRFHEWNGRGDALPDDEALIRDVELAAAGLPTVGWGELSCAFGHCADREWMTGIPQANKIAFRLRAGVTGDEVRDALARAQGARRAA